jgi:DNA adenine methylase
MAYQSRMASTSDRSVLPFLRWPGGKAWTAERIARVARAALRGTYYEPFLGGGAVFFCLRPRISVLSDVNAELIETYEAVRDRVAAVSAALRELPVSKRDFYRIRQSSPTGVVARAARFLYLNRTAFSGIYRVNQRGEFNVPYGGGQRTPRILLNTPRLRDASATLRRAQLRRSDFEPMLQSAKRGDVVYCDPTYTVTHDNNGFVRYNEENFSWADQERLAKSALAAARKGVRVLVTNAHHAEIRKLYRGVTQYTLVRNSTLCPDASRRREVKEYLILL